MITPLHFEKYYKIATVARPSLLYPRFCRFVFENLLASLTSLVKESTLLIGTVHLAHLCTVRPDLIPLTPNTTHKIR